MYLNFAVVIEYQLSGTNGEKPCLCANILKIFLLPSSTSTKRLPENERLETYLRRREREEGEREREGYPDIRLTWICSGQYLETDQRALVTRSFDDALSPFLLPFGC